MIVDEVRKIVLDACNSPSNTFGDVWGNHFAHVVMFAKDLAKRTGADEEIVEIAALLHDYASISNKDWCEDHHIKGAELAEGILKRLGYPQDRIDRVKHCIYAHRGSKSIPRETKEAQCVADADAMSHFYNIPALMWVALVNKGLDAVAGKKWVADKLERSWNKLSPLAKEIVKEKYDAARTVLG
jgi:predicted hydrolase (HD superfamily)